MFECFRCSFFVLSGRLQLEACEYPSQSDAAILMLILACPEFLVVIFYAYLTWFRQNESLYFIY